MTSKRSQFSTGLWHKSKVFEFENDILVDMQAGKTMREKCIEQHRLTRFNYKSYDQVMTSENGTREKSKEKWKPQTPFKRDGKIP